MVSKVHATLSVDVVAVQCHIQFFGLDVQLRCMAGCSSDGRLWTGLFEKKIKSVLTSEKETLVQTWQFVPFALTLIQGSNIRMDTWTIQLPTDPSISVFQVVATFWIFVSGICAEMLTSA